tara:strand:+ start:1384 stop:2043 length:660 start_codon:yes stop_codon:yes gene_type:complete
MIRFDQKSKITEIKKQAETEKIQTANSQNQSKKSAASRPHVVDAKVYKVKSAFVKNSVFITLSYIETPNGRRPIEIFINSKDLNRAPEYVVLTRLISAIFRRATNPMFILEELQGIHDPNGGSFKEGKYYHSFYGEVAETIEKFFYEVGIVKKPKNDTEESYGNDIEKEENVIKVINENVSNKNMNASFRICPSCSSKSLKTENGCDTCVECGYSKCDK